MYNGGMKRIWGVIILLVLGTGCGVSPDRAMVQAAGNGDLETMDRLCQEGADVNALVDGYTALTLAMDKGHPEAVPLLLKYKPNLSLANEKMHTPLQLAAFNGYQLAARQLLEAGADVDEAGCASPPLLLAILGDQPAIVKLLIEFKVDLGVTWAGKTPLMVAAENAKIAILPVLAKAGSP